MGAPSSGPDAKPPAPAPAIDGLTLGGECPDAGPTAESEMAAQASAPIPLKVGLTLSYTWQGKQGDYEHECLTQVKAVDARGVSITQSCPVGADHELAWFSRRVCRVDLRDAYIYHPGFVTKLPDVLAGSTTFSLSTKSFAELKNSGEIRLRYLDIKSRRKAPQALFVDFDQAGSLKKQDTSERSPYKLDLFDTADVIVNDRMVPLPIINVAGMLGDEQVRAKVLDEAVFPLMLDYEDIGWHYHIRYTNISFPTEHDIERELSTNKHVDVYGIYFDFGSDRLRPESEPVLREIGEAMQKNPQWKLLVQGHTDNVGVDTLNLDLSQRRSAAVRKALIERYSVTAERLETGGLGASQPKESNDTPSGRARNRRVELIRE